MSSRSSTQGTVFRDAKDKPKGPGMRSPAHVIRGWLSSKSVRPTMKPTNAIRGRGRNLSRRAAGLTALWVVFGAFALTASPAAADRSYESQITEANGAALRNPDGLTVDGSNNLWVTEAVSGGTVNKYGTTGTWEAHTEMPPWGTSEYIESATFSAEAGEVFIADSNHDDLWGLNPSDDSYSTKDLSEGLGGGCCYIKVAADNSGGPTNGDLYVSSSNSVIRIKANGEGANFTSGANTLTGPFSSPGALAVDPQGDLYVAGSSTVYEFEPSGVLLREITEFEGSPLGFITAVAVDPSSENVLVAQADAIDEFTASGESNGKIAEANLAPFGHIQGLAVDSSGKLYAADGANNVVDVFSPGVILPKIAYEAVSNQTQTSGTLNASVDLNGGPEVTACSFEYGTDTSYGSSVPCSPATPYSSNTSVSAGISGLTTEATTHYRIVLVTSNGTKRGPDQTYTPHNVTSLTTESASNVEPTSATLNGSWIGNNTDTHYFFQWGSDKSYGHVTAMPPGDDDGSTMGVTSVHTDINSLEPITTYHYRIVAANSTGTSIGQDVSFTTPPNAPMIVTSVTGVQSDTASLHAQINPGGGDTTYHFEWGAADCAAHPEVCTTTPIPDGDVGAGISDQSVSTLLSGLMPGTTYHFRVVATNSQSPPGGTASSDRTFTTYPFTPFNDPCPNAHVRQQTGSALLLDCRAYELVSAANAGGYDVESDLVAGQTPFGGYPQAAAPSRVLYGVHNGALPASGRPDQSRPRPLCRHPRRKRLEH